MTLYELLELIAEQDEVIEELLATLEHLIEAGEKAVDAFNAFNEAEDEAYEEGFAAGRHESEHDYDAGFTDGQDHAWKMAQQIIESLLSRDVVPEEGVVEVDFESATDPDEDGFYDVTDEWPVADSEDPFAR